MISETVEGRSGMTTLAHLGSTPTLSPESQAADHMERPPRDRRSLRESQAILASQLFNPLHQPPNLRMKVR